MRIAKRLGISVSLAGSGFLLLLLFASTSGQESLNVPDPSKPMADPNYVCFSTAATITAEAIGQAMNTVKANLHTEKNIETMLGDYFVSRRVPRLPCWDGHHNVATGENTIYIDHQATTRKVLPGDLVLIDTGARYIYACSDVARTFPVGGKFKTDTQRLHYYLVLNAMRLGENLATGNIGTMSLQQIDARMRNYLATFGISDMYDQFYHYIGCGNDVHGMQTGWDPAFPIQPGQYFSLEVLVGFKEFGRRYVIHFEDTFAVLSGMVVRLSAKCPRDFNPPLFDDYVVIDSRINGRSARFPGEDLPLPDPLSPENLRVPIK